MVIAVVLAGCAGVPRGPDYARVPLDSELRLADEHVADANGFLYFQGGRRVSAPNRFAAPWCRLRSGVGPVPRQWRVTGFDVLAWDSGGVAPGPGFVGRENDSVELVDYRSLMDLRTADGRSGRLRCVVRAVAGGPQRYLTPEQIRTILEPAAELASPAARDR
ncbi:hypothetical protein [Sediminicurvatus halobius]|uniref:DUF3576 domain-containing protein n=1 Tax=Sediminicurvatus halobius TaxID=2182432 RepID=A0A2U2N0E6_9GAMM|nr:hypothetical protein [Spiribacter halobius]PWG62590.1 hypothetical protein DEM34_11620 [Spiribacter halobius]UEX78492.1 hypothetical protein LMH63_02295 [Spiribacter halobius]